MHIRYKRVIDPENGIKRETVWEARKNIAECFHSLAQRARLDGKNELAEEYFHNAESWFLAAAKIWEPELDPRRAACKHPNNATLHGLLVRFYFDRGDFSQAEKQVRMFLSREIHDSLSPDHKNYHDLIRLDLGIALLGQHRPSEAIDVLKTLPADRVSPKYWGSLANAAREVKRTDLLEEIWQACEAARPSFNDITWSSFANAAGEVERADLLEEIWQACEAARLNFDNPTWRSFIKAAEVLSTPLHPEICRAVIHLHDPRSFPVGGHCIVHF